jgi:hypothetical protein
LFGQIKEQSGLAVVFSPNSAIQNKCVTLPATEGTVAQLLDAVLPAEGLSWKKVENYIVVGPARPVAPKVSVPKPVEMPIRIGGSELRNFAVEEVRGPDSIGFRTVERGPFEFTAPDKRFAVPGTALSVVPSSENLPHFALKTNVLHGEAGLAPNLYGEVGLGRRTSLEAGFARNGWNRNGTVGNNRKLIHGGVTGDFRWWPCERFNGHFFGAHAFWRFYNVGGHDIPFVNFEREYRYEGTAIGGGVSYGYSLPVAPRWNVEFNVGVGAARMSYRQYGCDKCGTLKDTVTKTYFGPTRAGITLTFLIK